jgi:RNA polymerase sigma-70 factor (ECF subfamily)
MTDEEMKNGPCRAAVEADAGTFAQEELEQIYHRHYELVFRAAYRITGSVMDAEDVLQTVFLRLARRGVNEQSIERIESYLYRAAVNTALDVMGRRQRDGLPLDSLNSVPAPAHSANPDRAFSGVEIRQWLRAAIARLSPTAAEMFVLRYFEGKENPEIARMLETTAPTVAVTLHRTRERLFEDFRVHMGGQDEAE